MEKYGIGKNKIGKYSYWFTEYETLENRVC